MVVPSRAVDGRRSRRRRVRTAALVTCAVLALGLAVLPHPAITVPWFVAPLQSLVPVLSLVAAVGAVVLTVARQRWAALVLGAGAVAGLVPALVPMPPPAPPASPAGSAASDGTEELTLLSLNTEYAGVDPTALAAAIEEYGVDVLVLLEADEGLVGDLRARGALEGLPHRTAEIPDDPQGGPAGGAVILSAHPLRSEGVAPRFAGYRHFDQPVAVVQDPGLGPVRVVGIHPVPPVGPDFVPSWDETLRGLDGWQSGRADLPLVLAGDFNASGAHPQFRALAEGFTPAAAVGGPWPGPT
ncbi:endonuclease/exonuclease/phosphatase family protein [Cellulosimicrobium funkei]|nr:endonuclease/exonuclease/phosphatase family protein [Cellulosimicrobium funkei]